MVAGFMVSNVHGERDLAAYVPLEVEIQDGQDPQKRIPEIARDPSLSDRLVSALRSVPTKHRIILGDSRHMGELADESVHLVLTSPPYWNIKPYESGEGQLGLIESYEEFLAELDKVWQECLRVLVPGGRMVVVVGDVLLPRRRFGRHVVFPLHASIQEHCREIGFDNLAPIIWYKIGNAALEASGASGSFLGKPYEPNAVVKNDIEYILFQRKPGGYRSPSIPARLLSVIPAEDHRRWFQQVWDIKGASTRDHPAPFPELLAERLVRMFSFAGDTVLDPFVGSGTTSVVASRCGRDSVGYEVEEQYLALIHRRLEAAMQTALLL